LDAYEHAKESNNTNDTRPRIEHIETIATSDIARFGKLASSQHAATAFISGRRHFGSVGA